jgi:hypothetical protein
MQKPTGLLESRLLRKIVGPEEETIKIKEDGMDE